MESTSHNTEQKQDKNKASDPFRYQGQELTPLFKFRNQAEVAQFRYMEVLAQIWGMSFGDDNWSRFNAWLYQQDPNLCARYRVMIFPEVRRRRKTDPVIPPSPTYEELDEEYKEADDAVRREVLSPETEVPLEERQGWEDFKAFLASPEGRDTVDFFLKEGCFPQDKEKRDQYIANGLHFTIADQRVLKAHLTPLGYKPHSSVW